MAMNLGASALVALYLGTTALTSAYLGTTQVYSTGATPVLDVDLATDKSLPGDWTFSRTGAQWGVNSSGDMYKETTADTPVWNHDPQDSNASKGMRWAPTGTNIQRGSNDVDNSSYYSIGSGLTFDTAEGPDGVADSATEVTSPGSNAYHRQDNTITSDGTDWNFSAFIKKAGTGEGKWTAINMRFSGGTIIDVQQTVNTETGAVGTGATPPTRFTVHDFSPTYWRVEAGHANNNSGNTNLRTQIYASVNQNGIGGVAGSSTWWGLQTTNTEKMLDYIGHTTSSSLTRSSIAMSADPDANLIGDTAFTLAMQWHIDQHDGSGAHRWLEFNGVSGDSAFFTYNTDTRLYGNGKYQGSWRSTGQGDSYELGDHGYVLTAEDGKLAFYEDGTNRPSDNTDIAMPTNSGFNSLDICPTSGVDDWHVDLARVILYDEALGATAAAALSVYGADP